jgi:aldehyde dehydrogenase (NAD+)
VCSLITPWNWAMNQFAAEVLHEAGVPHGVFNLVNGTGSEVGARMSSHPEVDMVSFTGSTRANIQVAMASAPTVKRVAQELGRKSPNIILPTADFAAAVAGGIELLRQFGAKLRCADADVRAAMKKH